MAENFKTNNITYFAETNFRNERKKFGIKRKDRAKHTYIIGKTGTGKTTLLENMAVQDILNGEGVGIVDPHGDFAEKMMDFIPEERIGDVIYFAPHDMAHPIAFNVMENVDPSQRHLVANGLLGVFKKIWPDVWSPRMEYILNNCILALLEYPDSTLLGINRMLSDKNYRQDVIDNITDPVVKAFWLDEFSKYTERFMTEAGAAIQNKVGQFISNPLIRNIIGQSRSSFDIRDIMDRRKIFIMNLSKGRIGEENSRLIGAMLITKIYLAAMSRVDTPEDERPDFYLFVDEFQNFATESFKDILSEARKYRLSLILAHQYIAQMDEGVRDAVFGNIGTLITFRVGAYDAEVLEKEFSPEFTLQDIVNLGFGNIYLRLIIDGQPSRPFSASTLAPIRPEQISFREKIIEMSREKYATPREEVDLKIMQWHKPVENNRQSESLQNYSMSGSSSAPVGVKRSLPHTETRKEKFDYQPELFEATCAICEKKTFVPFKPDGKRPIFCKNHRARLAQQSTGSQVNLTADSSDSGFASKSAPKTISLKDLKDRRPVQKNDELREILNEVLHKKSETPAGKAKKNILKPGDKVKFE